MQECSDIMIPGLLQHRAFLDSEHDTNRPTYYNTCGGALLDMSTFAGKICKFSVLLNAS